MNAFSLRGGDDDGARHHRRRLGAGAGAGDDAGLATRPAVGIVVGLGTGLTALVLGATVATRWFAKGGASSSACSRRASATGQLGTCRRWRTSREAIRLARRRRRSSATPARARGDRRCRSSCSTGPPISGSRWSANRPRCRRRPPPPPRGRFCGAARCLRDASERRCSGCCSATFFICGATTNGLIQTHFISLCARFRGAVVTPRACWRPWGCSISSARSARAGCRTVRQSLAAVLVLRAARPVAALPAVRRFLVLRPVAIRGVLRPRLDRHRAADRAAVRAEFGAERADVVFGWISRRISSAPRRPPTARARRGPTSAPTSRPSSPPASCASSPR